MKKKITDKFEDELTDDEKYVCIKSFLDKYMKPSVSGARCYANKLYSAPWRYSGINEHIIQIFSVEKYQFS